MSELTTEDKQRIYTIAHKKYSDPFENIDRREGYMEGYKDATTFERENAQSSNDGLNDRIKELELERTSLKNKVYKKKIEKLEAERSEVNGKVARLEAAVWMLLHHVPDTPDMEPIREKCKAELNSLKTK